MSIYHEMVQADIKIDCHASDLYVEDCPESRAILANHGKQVDGWNVSRFMSNGKPWLDIPFEYSPYWEQKR